MNTIRLKKYVDQKGITLEELSKKTRIEIDDLQIMYTEGTFNGDKLGVNGLTDLMQALDVMNVTELIPTLK